MKTCLSFIVVSLALVSCAPSPAEITPSTVTLVLPTVAPTITPPSPTATASLSPTPNSTETPKPTPTLSPEQKAQQIDAAVNSVTYRFDYNPKLNLTADQQKEMVKKALRKAAEIAPYNLTAEDINDLINKSDPQHRNYKEFFNTKWKTEYPNVPDNFFAVLVSQMLPKTPQEFVNGIIYIGGRDDNASSFVFPSLNFSKISYTVNVGNFFLQNPDTHLPFTLLKEIIGGKIPHYSSELGAGSSLNIADTLSEAIKVAIQEKQNERFDIDFYRDFAYGPGSPF